MVNGSRSRAAPAPKRRTRCCDTYRSSSPALRRSGRRSGRSGSGYPGTDGSSSRCRLCRNRCRGRSRSCRCGRGRCSNRCRAGSVDPHSRRRTAPGVGPGGAFADVVCGSGRSSIGCHGGIGCRCRGRPAPERGRPPGPDPVPPALMSRARRPRRRNQRSPCGGRFRVQQRGTGDRNGNRPPIQAPVMSAGDCGRRQRQLSC
jgi:hypothetical protein